MASPSNGQKGQFRKLTLTVPQEYYEKLVRESARRKISREPNQLISALLREALTDYLAKLDAPV